MTWQRANRVLLVVAILFALGAGAAQGQGPETAKPAEIKGRTPVSNEILKITLPTAVEADLSNGAHLMVLEDHRVPTVSFQILIPGAGGYYDPADLPGLADTTASLMDEATKTKTSEQIAQQLDTMSASVAVAASEGSQIARVTGSCLSDQLDAVLGLAADILMNPSFPDAEISRYKARAMAALQQQRTDPEFLARERYQKAVYGSHPASSVGVTMESLKRITRDSLVGFHLANYVPDHAIIAVSGDITLAEARTKFGAALKDWAKSGKPRPGVIDAPNHGPTKVHLVNRPSSVQTNLVVGEQAISRMSPDYEVMQVMNTILGGSNGRLFRELRENKGYTYGAYSAISALRYRGDWQAGMDVRTEVTEPALRDLLAEIAKIREQRVPDAEFKDAQRSMSASFALSLESPGGILDLYVVSRLYNLPADYWDKYSDRIMAVTPAQVQAVAKRYLDPSKLQIVAVGDEAQIEKGLAKFGAVEIYDAEGRAAVLPSR